jgi:hypothetical protein
MFGPQVSPYEHTDHMVWLISDASEWLPTEVRQVLIDGIADWEVWLWSSGDWPSARSVFTSLNNSSQMKSFHWSIQNKDDALNRFQLAINRLELPESAEEIFTRFVNHDFVEKWISERMNKKAQ